MKKIPLKNYIIYSIIVLVTFAISIYIVMLFNRSKEYYENNSVLADVLYEILPKNNLSVSDNLNNYLLENSNLIIYISSGKDKDIKELEDFMMNITGKGYCIYYSAYAFDYKIGKCLMLFLEKLMIYLIIMHQMM